MTEISYCKPALNIPSGMKCSFLLFTWPTTAHPSSPSVYTSPPPDSSSDSSNDRTLCLHFLNHLYVFVAFILILICYLVFVSSNILQALGPGTILTVHLFFFSSRFIYFCCTGSLASGLSSCDEQRLLVQASHCDGFLVAKHRLMLCFSTCNA